MDSYRQEPYFQLMQETKVGTGNVKVYITNYDTSISLIRHKYIVRREYTIGQLTFIIRKRHKIDPNHSFQLMVWDEDTQIGVIPTPNILLGEALEKWGIGTILFFFLLKIDTFG